jgi:RimJ/RimL family protein N-acetyltransferase
MDNISITRMQESDIDELIPLAYLIWHAHYPGIITVEQIDYMLAKGYTREVILDEINRQKIIWLTIRDENGMIGFISVGPYGDEVWKLHKLYLLPDYQGKGIGAYALGEVERMAKERKLARLVLNVNKYNEKSIRAYRRAGWYVAEETCVDIGGGFVMDDYVMARDLV